MGKRLESSNPGLSDCFGSGVHLIGVGTHGSTKRSKSGGIDEGGNKMDRPSGTAGRTAVVKRSRRTVLAGMVGAIGVLGAETRGRATPAQAGTDGDVVLGKVNTASSPTGIDTAGVADVPAFARHPCKGCVYREPGQWEPRHSHRWPHRMPAMIPPAWCEAGVVATKKPSTMRPRVMDPTRTRRGMLIEPGRGHSVVVRSSTYPPRS
jgi:hypothetical protein